VRFPFDHKKAAQAAAFLLKRHGGRMNYTVMIKLLYTADRTALLDSGMPITGDYMVSMDNGTVLSIIYDLVKGKERHPAWTNYISPREGYEVCLVKENPDNEQLSKYELRILAQIDNELGHMTWDEMSAWTHKLPEWHHPQGSSERIDPVDILRLARKSPEEIEQIVKDAEEFFFLKSA
jgi:uncharacterized phage-associated protein